LSSRHIDLRKALRLLVNKIYRYPVWISLIVSVGLMLLCALILAIEMNVTIFEGLTDVLPLFLGELGSLEWQSGLAKFTGAVGLIAGVVFITIIGAKIVSWFVNLSLREGRIMKKVSYKNHIIICGWNIQGKNIIKQLLTSDIEQRRPIVILADLDKKPVGEDIVDFISGDPTKEEDLKRAGIMKANTAIILSQIGPGFQAGINPDAQAVLMTLAVEALRRDVYTCVQLLNSEYKKHLEHAQVDEYICLDRMSGNLMVASALNHGLSWILSELLEFTSGSEFYKKSVPKGFVNMGFRKVAKILHDEDMTLIAVETKIEVPKMDEFGNAILDKDGKPEMKMKENWIINPQKKDYPEDYILKQNDKIYIIAVNEPSDKKMEKIAENSISLK
jgi:voltage-gated potassium channel